MILLLLAAANMARNEAPKPPPDAIMVQLLGETSRLRAPASSEPEPPAPEPQAPSEAEAPPQPPAPPEAAASTDALPLGPKAKSKPPEITRRQKPPPVKPPEVTAETPPPPRKAPPPRREARTKPPKPAPPRNVYDMLNRTLGRDTVAQTLGTPQGRPNPDIQRYLQRVMAKIQANWASPRPDISPRLVVGYAFTVEANGQISSIRLTQPSGEPAFDRSVQQALRKASPLPPLHPAFGSRHTFSVGFNPERMGAR